MSRQLKKQSPSYHDIVVMTTQDEAQTNQVAVTETIQFVNKA